jgi:hypothetical protein
MLKRSRVCASVNATAVPGTRLGVSSGADAAAAPGTAGGFTGKAQAGGVSAAALRASVAATGVTTTASRRSSGFIIAGGLYIREARQQAIGRLWACGSRRSRSSTRCLPGGCSQRCSRSQHNLTGSRVTATGLNTWTIEWTAPSTPANPMQVNVAANASNNDDSPIGDDLYLKMIRSALSEERGGFSRARSA